jgi:hypothetical protein
MADSVLDSPFLADNNLNVRFKGTYGFSVVFRRDGIQAVRSEFPELGPFLDLTLRKDCNAFFLNPLLLADGSRVAPHRDYSLHAYCPDAPAPRAVSVLYLRVPPLLAGGRLRLYRDDVPLVDIAPEGGMVLEFRGNLRHEVTPVSAGAPEARHSRISLVVEQYRVAKRDLAAIPPMHVGTRRDLGFDDLVAIYAR